METMKSKRFKIKAFFAGLAMFAGLFVGAVAISPPAQADFFDDVIANNQKCWQPASGGTYCCAYRHYYNPHFGTHSWDRDCWWQ